MKNSLYLTIAVKALSMLLIINPKVITEIMEYGKQVVTMKQKFVSPMVCEVNETKL